MTAGFIGDLNVKLVSENAQGESIWELKEDFGFHSDLLGRDIFAKAGEQTDFASIPRVPIIWLAEGDKGHKAAVIHDHLYQESPHTMNRLSADNVLREALIVEGFSQEEADTWWTAVRFGGGGHWDAGLSVAAISPAMPLGASGS